MNANNLPAATHYAHTHRGYLEAQTRAVYVHAGVVHVARRFFRDDLPESGKIEVYTVAPGVDASSAFSEDWLGYASPETKSGRAAIAAIEAATAQRAGDALAADMEARYAAIEL